MKISGYGKRKMNEDQLFKLIRLSLWGNGEAAVDQDVFDEMRQQAIATLPTPYLSSLGLSPELKKEWTLYTLQQLSYCAKCNYEQTNLPITVPYIILKGTSVSQYYPYPEYRTMGDIDIMIRREDYETARNQLADNGYQIIKEIYKEANLVKDGVCIDLHRQFASLNNPDYVKYLDDLIIDNINPTHILPDPVNGLTLLDHINQHLEEGLGLRQIIDWMMYVDKCLPDQKWPEFYELVKKIGLDKLAVVCTRMCELYLGLSHREWCADADSDLCHQLMDYILSCGNFGNKKVSGDDVSEKAFAYARTPKAWFRLLQKQGEINWKAAREHALLRPFAWIYQLHRYISKGLKRDQAVSKIKNEYKAAKKKMAMFDALGVKTATKGIVMYKDGKYVKE